MSRLALSKYLPNELIRVINYKLLPDKPSKYDLFQEMLNKYNNTNNKHYCLKCQESSCLHLVHVYASNYNILRIMSGLSGLSYTS